ncbi:affinity cAMP-specific and IBMX-insensitive 3',5'-cyclic phosphodiesterase [Seminavis robusta]|uniref:Phosphodiesterase n=1 Tax=Seminavis robusta TaxID=568900 RepID=A0A9N8D8R3_9STRA|nr:affinity cAMP-specific and IBMX-insensitive 3',5'-cyclic phosphodiesterase [Seminavis robusta]|eukprot:Sro38_g023580.1 affinity cAMP-specific and IBMX-insensitive 3',5'-cyclic phosphodiesterase (1019) ;mRNA; f:19670-22726
MRSSFFDSLQWNGDDSDDSSTNSNHQTEEAPEEKGQFFSVESNSDLPAIEVLGTADDKDDDGANSNTCNHKHCASSQDDSCLDAFKRRSTGSQSLRRSVSDSNEKPPAIPATVQTKRHSHYIQPTNVKQLEKKNEVVNTASASGRRSSGATNNKSDSRRRNNRRRSNRRSMSPLRRAWSFKSSKQFDPPLRRTSSGDIIQAVVGPARAAGKMVVQGGVIAGKGISKASHAAVDTAFEAGHKTANAVKGAGTMTAHAVVDASYAVADAGAMVGNTVVHGGKVIVDGTTQVVVGGSKAIVDGGKVIVDGTAQVVVGGSKAIVDGGKVIVDGTTQAVLGGSKALVGGTTQVIVGTTNAVGYGGKALVEGTAQAIVGTTNVVGYGGKTVFNSTRRVYRSLKNATGLKSSADDNKSKWEEGLDVIDSLLDPTGEVYQVMTPQQRKQLAGVKKLLLNAPSGKNNKDQHIPLELIRLHSEHQRMGASLEDPSLRSSVQSAYSSSLGSTGHLRTAPQSNYILQEFAGIRDTSRIVQEYENDSGEEERVDMATASTTDSTAFSDLDGSVASTTPEYVYGSLPPPPPKLLEPSEKYYVPPEFTCLSPAAQLQVFDMLKWNSLGRWDFNVFELNRVTEGKPLLFLGWAILGAPYSQHAMTLEMGRESDLESLEGYKFTDEIQLPPEKLCNFVRTIEEDYTATNQYHNGIHGADVLQTLHALIQSATNEEFIRDCPKINLLSILLAAICHDVCHPGTTNAFHVKLHSELAVLYNDTSVLENWHVAHSFSRILGIDLLGPNGVHTGHELVTKHNLHQNTTSENNILCNATGEQFNVIRKLMIDAILHTDMTNHFQMVNEARGMLIEQQDGSLKKEELTWRMLMFMLHMADISGQAKEELLSKQWTQRCMDEFFAQGDVERDLGMPISPNCDRNVVGIADSQVGFIRFVVEPAYEVLGDYIPFVRDDVLPLVHDNLLRYLEQQEMFLEEESFADTSPITEQKEQLEGDVSSNVVLNVASPVRQGTLCTASAG